MKKAFLILVGVLMVSLIVWGSVYAFTMGKVDGQWTCIEPDGEVCGSAYEDNWATGPSSGSTDYDNATTVWYDFTDQSDYGDNDPVNNDWNQVRYGSGTGGSGFGYSSGFGFDGVDDINEGVDGVLTEGESFLLGKWCHYNNPIAVTDLNLLEDVDLAVRIEGISCPTGYTIDDNLLEFKYRFTLDETPNSANPCEYPDADNTNGCADGVFLGAVPIETPFVCTSDSNPENSISYTVSILGSVPLDNPLDTCPDTPGSLAFEYYSAEDQDNCSCLYAQIKEVEGTAVELNDFSATSTQAGVEITWETAVEVDNLGFNLYRASSPFGIKEKLNENMIPSKAIGSTSGASYTFLDENILAAGKYYYYWLESLDLSGSSELIGPVHILGFK